MEYKKCGKCGEYGYGECHCKPFMVYFPDYYGEEMEEVYGNIFEDVVEKIAKEVNEDEPVFDQNLFDEPIEITDESGVTKKFNCTASLSVDYFAHEIEATQGDHDGKD